MLGIQLGEDRWQHFPADYLTCGDSDGSMRSRPTHRCSNQRCRRCLEALRVRLQLQGGIRWRQALLGPGEKRHAERLLQGVDVPADGRLGQAAIPRRGGQRARA